MNSYKDMEIFHDARRLAIEVHRVSLLFPKFELYEEGSQLRRSSKSIASNIVEGFGRRKYKADFIKHLVYSRCECDETLLHLDIVFETRSLNDELKYKELTRDYTILGKRINRLILWLEEH